jgi:uncharacterized protein YlbG (UPF0298 family)/predicted nucleotidyltransferase
MITREQIIPPIIEKLNSLGFVQAVWEGGAIAFDRVDDWSDIDLAVVIEDSRSGEAFAAVEEAIKSVTPIETVYDIKQPGWEGHEQKFYKLKDASKFLLIDLSVINESAPDKLLEPEIHGRAKVHFDKTGVTKKYSLNKEAHGKKIKNSITRLKLVQEVFGMMPEKEINRGNHIEAVVLYYNYILRSLLEALKIKYTPTRFNFFVRYVHYELPQDIVKRLQDLYYVSSPEDLKKKYKEATNWLEEELSKL